MFLAASRSSGITNPHSCRSNLSFGVPKAVEAVDFCSAREDCAQVVYDNNGHCYGMRISSDLDQDGLGGGKMKVFHGDGCVFPPTFWEYWLKTLERLVKLYIGGLWHIPLISEMIGGAEHFISSIPFEIIYQVDSCKFRMAWNHQLDDGLFMAADQLGMSIVVRCLCVLSICLKQPAIFVLWRTSIALWSTEPWAFAQWQRDTHALTWKDRKSAPLEQLWRLDEQTWQDKTKPKRWSLLQRCDNWPPWITLLEQASFCWSPFSEI